MEGFTKEVLMMWTVLVAERGRCIAPRAGRRGMKRPVSLQKCTRFSPCTDIQYELLLHSSQAFDFM